MKVDVIPTVLEARQEDLTRRTIVIIDVLRSTSTILAAFLAGCTVVFPVETCGKALPLRDEKTYLAGERYCKKIQGFDFSNSPLEILQHDLSNKQLAITTTNGTQALRKSNKGEHILVASFLNGAAVAKRICQLKQNVSLFCAGTRGEFALEDALCAGFILNEMMAIHDDLLCSDMAKMTHAAYQQLQDRLPETLLNTTTGRRLKQLGLEEDILFCAQRNMFNLVPVQKDERIFVHPFS